MAGADSQKTNFGCQVNSSLLVPTHFDQQVEAACEINFFALASALLAVSNTSCLKVFLSFGIIRLSCGDNHCHLLGDTCCL